MEHRAAAISLAQSAEADAAFAMALLQLYVTSGDEAAIQEVRSNMAATTEGLSRAQAEHEAHGHEDPDERIKGFGAAAALASEMVDRVIALRRGGDVRGG